MLVIRFKGWSVKLDHQVGGAGKFGIWSFHGSESSYVPDMETILRHAAIRPAEPKEGGEVEVFICDSRMPQDEWRAVGPASRLMSRTADPVPVFVPIDANSGESWRLKALILLLSSALAIAKKIAW